MFPEKSTSSTQRCYLFLTRHLMTQSASCIDRSASSRTSLLDPRTTTDTVLPWFWIPVIYKQHVNVVRIRDLKFLLWVVHSLVFQGLIILADSGTGTGRDMDKWVVWFYVEPFTLHLNRDRGRHLLSPIILVPVHVSDIASVSEP